MTRSAFLLALVAVAASAQAKRRGQAVFSWAELFKGWRAAGGRGKAVTVA